jgi:hypothetical protein
MAAFDIETASREESQIQAFCRDNDPFFSFVACYPSARNFPNLFP